MNANEMLKEVVRLEREGKTQEAIELNEKLEIALSSEIKSLKNIIDDGIIAVSCIRGNAERQLKC